MKLRIMASALIFGAFFILMNSSLFAATIATTPSPLQATCVPDPADISIVGDVNFALTNIIPNGTWDDAYPTPNSRPNPSQDPWLVVAPIRIPLRILNPGAYNLYIYTDHANSTYLASKPAILNRINNENIPISGLLNVENITSENYNRATVPMIAWFDYKKTGQITTDPKANWIWITDKLTKRDNPLLTGTYLLGSTDYEQGDVYIRTCWNVPKLSGTYFADIYFLMDYE